MGYLRAALSWFGGLALAVAALVCAPVLTLLALPLADSTNKVDIFAKHPWLSFLNTYDDLGCNQGMYEPVVAAVFADLGWWVKTWYWLGLRNQFYGAFYRIAPALKFGAKGLVAAVTPHLITVRQDGKLWFQFTWSGNWSSTHYWGVKVGWKLADVQQFFATAPTDGLPHNPTWDFTVRPYSAGQV